MPDALTPEVALRTILDQVDYTSGACRPNELVGAVLPTEVIQLCKDSLDADRSVKAKLASRGFMSRTEAIRLLKSRAQGGQLSEELLRALCQWSADLLHRDRARDGGS